MQIDGRNIQIEDNGQVMIEREPGFWVQYDMQHHIRAEFVEGGVKAEIFDFLGEPTSLDGVEIYFKVGTDDISVLSESGVAVLQSNVPIGYAIVSSPGMRPAEVGEPPKELTDIDLMGVQLVQRELEALELKAENTMLGGLLVELELRLLALEGGAAANE